MQLLIKNIVYLVIANNSVKYTRQGHVQYSGTLANSNMYTLVFHKIVIQQTWFQSRHMHLPMPVHKPVSLENHQISYCRDFSVPGNKLSLSSTYSHPSTYNLSFSNINFPAAVSGIQSCDAFYMLLFFYMSSNQYYARKLLKTTLDSE